MLYLLSLIITFVLVIWILYVHNYKEINKNFSLINIFVFFSFWSFFLAYWEIVFTTLIQNIFSFTMYQYHFLPTHNWFSHSLSFLLWWLYWVWWYFYSMAKISKTTLSNWFITMLDAPILEVFVNIFSLILVWDYYFYYTTWEFLHITSIYAIIIYFFLWLVLYHLRESLIYPLIEYKFKLLVSFVFLFAWVMLQFI